MTPSAGMPWRVRLIGSLGIARGLGNLAYLGGIREPKGTDSEANALDLILKKVAKLRSMHEIFRHRHSLRLSELVKPERSVPSPCAERKAIGAFESRNKRVSRSRREVVDRVRPLHFPIEVSEHVRGNVEVKCLVGEVGQCTAKAARGLIKKGLAEQVPFVSSSEFSLNPEGLVAFTRVDQIGVAGVSDGGERTCDEFNCAGSVKHTCPVMPNVADNRHDAAGRRWARMK